jgi:hypothetical protein
MYPLIGSNLWIIQKNLPDADPESGLGSNAGSLDFSIVHYQQPETLVVNQQLNFKR